MDQVSDPRLRLDDSTVRSLIAQFDTPLYVIDETHLRTRIRTWLDAARAAWTTEDGPGVEVSFASKANSTLAVLQIAHQEGCCIDVASEGELEAALRAGIPAADCHLHGNNKSVAELRRAAEVEVAQIVVDSLEEIDRLAKLRHCPNLILRLAPGVNPETNSKISTGQADTKFGFNIADGSAEHALRRILDLRLPLVGFHCHVGSQLLNPNAQIQGGAAIAEFAVRMFRSYQFKPSILNVGGGLGVHYTEQDQPMDIFAYCQAISAAVREAIDGRFPVTLAHEPGRSLIAESGVTLYTVGAVKRTPRAEGGTRTYVATDGGLSDNPRPALYGSKYPVHWVSGDGRPADELFPVRVSGKHCETDMLFDEIPMSADVKAGDHVQVLCTGAYNSSMASNYNRYARPATVVVREDGSATLVQRRDTFDEMFARESLI